jgi:hypothetical protein
MDRNSIPRPGVKGKPLYPGTANRAGVVVERQRRKPEGTKPREIGSPAGQEPADIYRKPRRGMTTRRRCCDWADLPITVGNWPR